MRKLFLTLTVLAAALLAGCEQDAYEKGEGENSLVRADFVEAHVNADKKIVSVTTDDGELLNVSNPFNQNWVQKGDTLYRAMLYYRPADAGQVEAVSCGKIEVASLIPLDSIDDGMKTDPVRLESVWMGKNRRYLNVGLYLKSGATDDEDAVHRLGIVAREVVSHADGRQTLLLQLYHDQGGVPEYYSQRNFFSIALDKIPADSLSISINTYDGEVVKTFCLAQE
ncbi:MAG: NigD-like N-terminal domain-containing protein [Prevotella sp.]|nr:NigD-like N-terminal domain-containing protein [Prevotella sp.]